ncbi:MAG: hypothetical protein KC766_06630 [Myxococcales bacterium]|nr:hypothetical protein [Myxococcales bacterium]
MRKALVCVGLGLWLSSLGACLDLEPTTGVEQQLPQGDGGALSDECLACTRGDSALALDCAEAYGRCAENEACSSIIDCSLERSCFNLSGSEQINCSIPCGFEAGLTSLDDPAIQLVAAWSGCIIPACSEVCGFSGELPGAQDLPAN